jgi:hypothetical protein
MKGNSVLSEATLSDWNAFAESIFCRIIQALASGGVADGTFPVFLYSKKPEKWSLTGPLGDIPRILNDPAKY